MPLINGLEAMAVASALAKAGAKWTPFFRQPVDANGVAIGTDVRMGCMLGMVYRKGRSGTLQVDIPGVIVTKDVARFEGILADGCDVPKPGDEICTNGETGERTKIAYVATEAAPLIVLTMQE